VFCFVAGYLVYKEIPEGKYINCSISEISPDFTPAMKIACREHKKQK
jgi:hypothetical protein